MCLLCLEKQVTHFTVCLHSEIRQLLESLRKQHLDCIIFRRDVILIGFRVKCAKGRLSRQNNINKVKLLTLDHSLL